MKTNSLNEILVKGKDVIVFKKLAEEDLFLIDYQTPENYRHTTMTDTIETALNRMGLKERFNRMYDVCENNSHNQVAYTTIQKKLLKLIEPLESLSNEWNYRETDTLYTEEKLNSNIYVINTEKTWYGEYVGYDITLNTPNAELQGITIKFYSKITLEKYHQIVVHSLFSQIDQPIGIGDKKLLKDIAIADFYRRLQFQVSPERKGDQLAFEQIIDQFSSMALLELYQYGFSITQNHKQNMPTIYPDKTYRDGDLPILF